MTARFNYTGRKRIIRKGSKSEVLILLRVRVDSNVSFDVTLDLDRLGLPDDSKIVIECYYRTLIERFPWGTVGSPGAERSSVLEFVDPEVAKFTVKAVNDNGKILARATGIRPEIEAEPEGGDDRASLIAVKAVTMDQVWRIDVRPDERPLLEVNKDLRLKERLLSEPLARGLVFPSALREIASRYLAVNGFSSGDLWAMRVKDFLVDLSSEPLPTGYDTEIDDHAAQDWLEDVVSGYCQRFGIVSSIPVDEE